MRGALAASLRGGLRSLRLQRSQVQVLISSLDEALQFSAIRPRWVELEARLARARRGARGKNARERDRALAREMGFSVEGGRRQPVASLEERNRIVLKYCELTRTSGLVHFLEPEVLWATGFRGAVEESRTPEPIPDDLVPERQYVEAPIAPAGAVRVGHRCAPDGARATRGSQGPTAPDRPRKPVHLERLPATRRHSHLGGVSPETFEAASNQRL